MDCYWYRRLAGVDYAQPAIISSPRTFHFRQKLKIELYLGATDEFPELKLALAILFPEGGSAPRSNPLPFFNICLFFDEE